MFAENSLLDFAAQVASSKPVPGGGTVSAFCGYLSAALALKVCRLTLGKEQYINSHTEIEKVREEIENLKDELLVLMDEDAEAFDGVIKALRMPKTSPAEESRRREAIQRETLKAALVPLRTAEKCLEILKRTEVILEKGNPNAASDAGVAVHLAATGIVGAALNVGINIKGYDAEEFVKAGQLINAIQESKEKLLKDLKPLIEKKLI